MNKQKIVIIGLAVGLFLVTQYVILDKLAESRQQETLGVYKRGYDNALKDVMNSIYEKTQNCQITEISIGNLTRTVVDVDCLPQSSEKPSP